MSKDSSKPKKTEPQQSNGQSGITGFKLGLLTVLATIAIFFSAQIIAGMLVYLYTALIGLSDNQAEDWLTNSVIAQFSYSLLANALILAAIYWVMRGFRWNWAYIGLKRPKPGHVFAGILAAFPYYVIFLIITALVSALVPAFNPSQDQDIGFKQVSGAGSLALVFVSLVVLPPLIEEITVRGFLYTGVRNMLPTFSAALFVSVLFGAAHLAEGGEAGPLWVGALDTFVLSMVLIYLREKTGNLWAGITLHALKNGLAFLLIFILGVG